jgi:hypothetical protein
MGWVCAAMASNRRLICLGPRICDELKTSDVTLPPLSWPDYPTVLRAEAGVTPPNLNTMNIDYTSNNTQSTECCKYLRSYARV